MWRFLYLSKSIGIPEYLFLIMICFRSAAENIYKWGAVRSKYKKISLQTHFSLDVSVQRKLTGTAIND